ncbi:MAG: hypothetical protein Aurels2KO_24100 [Aureliella sp.]
MGCTAEPPSGSPATKELVAADQGIGSTKGTETRSESTSTGEFDSQIADLLSGKSEKLLLRVDPISSQQLAKLAECEELLDLLLDAGGVTDADMKTIAQLESTEHLRIRQATISDRGLEALCAGKLEQLAILNLPQAQISAAGIRHLQRLPSLTNLRLGGKQIDDAAVAEIAQLPKLRSLHLIAPAITGASLRSLAEAPKLVSFYLDDCDLPDADWNALFDAKPNLHVHVDQQHHDRDPSKHEH